MTRVAATMVWATMSLILLLKPLVLRDVLKAGIVVRVMVQI